MRRGYLAFSVLAAVFLHVFLPRASYAITYSFTRVVEGHLVDSFDMNNHGEVVWEMNEGDNDQIYTNLRGQITNDTVPEVRNSHPAINDGGEIVWVKVGGPGPFFSVYSNTRGRIPGPTATAQLSYPDINAGGEVIALCWDEGYTGKEVYSDVRGLITDTSCSEVNPSVNSVGEISWHCSDGNDTEIYSSVGGQLTDNDYTDFITRGHSVNDSGEIVWAGFDGNDNEIFSNIRGQLTDNDVYDGAPAINNLGEVVWMQYDPVDGKYCVYASSSGCITPDYDGRDPIINDSGQIAFFSYANEPGVHLADPIPASVPTVSEGGVILLFSVLLGSALWVTGGRGQKPT